MEQGGFFIFAYLGRTANSEVQEVYNNFMSVHCFSENSICLLKIFVLSLYGNSLIILNSQNRKRITLQRFCLGKGSKFHYLTVSPVLCFMKAFALLPGNILENENLSVNWRNPIRRSQSLQGAHLLTWNSVTGRTLPCRASVCTELAPAPWCFPSAGCSVLSVFNSWAFLIFFLLLLIGW